MKDKDDTIPLKSIIKDIICLEKSLIKLLEKGKPYEKLLKHLMFKYYAEDYETSFPSISELAKKMNMSLSTLKKQLQQIHSDALLLAYDGDLFSIKKFKYVFYIKSWRDKTMHVTYHNLPNVPRVGETVDMPCFSGYLGSSSFYVESINYEYFSDEIVTTIYLKIGSFNQYFKLKKDEVIFKRIISPFESISITDYQMEKVIQDHLHDKFSLY
jgi:DNA-binding transcriptional regulator YhcF (GntR family)